MEKDLKIGDENPTQRWIEMIGERSSLSLCALSSSVLSLAESAVNLLAAEVDVGLAPDAGAAVVLDSPLVLPPAGAAVIVHMAELGLAVPVPAGRGGPGGLPGGVVGVVVVSLVPVVVGEPLVVVPVPIPVVGENLPGVVVGEVLLGVVLLILLHSGVVETLVQHVVHSLLQPLHHVLALLIEGGDLP